MPWVLWFRKKCKCLRRRRNKSFWFRRTCKVTFAWGANIFKFGDLAIEKFLVGQGGISREGGIDRAEEAIRVFVWPAKGRLACLEVRTRSGHPAAGEVLTQVPRMPRHRRQRVAVLRCGQRRRGAGWRWRFYPLRAHRRAAVRAAANPVFAKEQGRVFALAGTHAGMQQLPQLGGGHKKTRLVPGFV